MWDEQFEEILRKHLPFLSADERLAGDANLQDYGLDSMATVELLAALERTYGVRFLDDLLTMETFASPNRLWAGLSSLQPAN